ncbi:MAG: nucleotide sugar dehydrogenase, partial [Phycisphaerales bacterium]|nr:nucleotide sugar dehydrogenase [Phycisphaerales bacterium]
GFGGHCVPIDPYYLAWKARAAGVESRFIELAGDVNRDMPRHVVHRCAAALAESDLSLAGADILVLKFAYKRNVADVRESPSFEIIELLREAGSRVSYHDPHVQNTWPGRRHDLGMTSIEWSDDALASADAVIIATDHDWYDWTRIGQHARLIIDTRNAMARATEPPRARVVRA